MNDAHHDAVSEHRLPAAQSQGFAQVRVVTFTDPDSTGPLAVPPALAAAASDVAALADVLPRVPLGGYPEPAAG